MSLLNYTTTVAAQKTLGQIVEMLSKAGARQIMTDFNESGEPEGLSFSITTHLGARGFILPVRVEQVAAVMRKDRTIPNRYKNPEQAQRVAWRIVKDWLEAQLALIATEMVTLDQVMLPYMRTVDGATFYASYVAGIGTQPAAIGAGS